MINSLVLSRKIKYLRHKAALTQEQLAKKMEVSRTTITNWETNYAKPTSEQIDKLSVIFEVSKEWFWEENDEFQYEVYEDEIKETTPFGKKLTLLRKSKRWTQEYVANLLNLSRMAYGRYERGTAEPNLETLTIIAKIYEVSLDQLLDNEFTLTSLELDDWILDMIEDEKKKETMKTIWLEIKKL